MIKPILGAIVALALLGTAALAQGITQDDVVAACAGGDAQQDACLTAVHAYLQAVGAEAGTINAAVADLVVALASGEGAGRPVAVAAIREAAAFSTDAGQVARIDEIAATIASGDTGRTAAIGEIPGSPA